MEKKERPKEFKDFRCKGKNKKERECGVLLFRYKITDEEMIIQSKCTSCNTFSILHLPFTKK